MLGAFFKSLFGQSGIFMSEAILPRGLPNVRMYFTGAHQFLQRGTTDLQSGWAFDHRCCAWHMAVWSDGPVGSLSDSLYLTLAVVLGIMG